MSDPSKLSKNILLRFLLSLRQEDRSGRQTHFQTDGLISHSPFTPQLTRSSSIRREDHAREEPGKNCSAELQLLFKKSSLLFESLKK